MSYYKCKRDGCEESFKDSVLREKHVVEDHDPLAALPGYPRSPDDR